MSVLSFRDNLNYVDVVKQFEALTALASAHRDFLARGDPQRISAAAPTHLRQRRAWVRQACAAPDTRDSDQADAPSPPRGISMRSASGIVASSSQCSSAHGGAATCVGQATIRLVDDAAHSEGEASMADGEDG